MHSSCLPSSGFRLPWYDHYINVKQIMLNTQYVFPLNQVLELNEYIGVRAVAIHGDMHTENLNEVWKVSLTLHNRSCAMDALLTITKDIQNGTYNVLLTSPEQCRRIEGHTTRLSNLLQQPRFVRRIRTMVVDECHHVFTYGVPATGEERSFRPAWNAIGSLRLKLSVNTPCLALTAAAPPEILETVKSSLRLRDPFVLKDTVNRSNQCFAIHRIHGGLSNYNNLRMLVPPHSMLDILGPIKALELLKCQPKTIVFCDERKLVAAIPDALYAMLPRALQPLARSAGLFRFYHSQMSGIHLDKAYLAFLDDSCRVLVATSGAATVTWSLSGMIC